MRLGELKKTVERNIQKLFIVFNRNPAIFLSEADVKCYLYSLLINDPSISKVMPQFKYPRLRRKSNTILVHTEVKGERKIEDIAVLKPAKTIDYTSYYTSIGIEIKFNRKEPARAHEDSGILDDIKKLKDELFGYLIWLNWDREIREDQLRKVKNTMKKYRNVKFFYIDLFSKPVKTNVKL